MAEERLREILKKFVNDLNSLHFRLSHDEKNKILAQAILQIKQWTDEQIKEARAHHCGGKNERIWRNNG